MKGFCWGYNITRKKNQRVSAVLTLYIYTMRVIAITQNIDE